MQGADLFADWTVRLAPVGTLMGERFLLSGQLHPLTHNRPHARVAAGKT
jgi:hypothetical protein